MLYLIASCIALLLGPLFYRFLSNGSGLQKGLDGFIFVSLGGLVLIHILPELLEHGGLLSILFVLLGLWGPTASEKLFQRYSEITHNLTLSLGIGGLLLHTLTDGGAMVLAQHDSGSSLLALGIILHRLPVGLAIWWLLKPQVGSRWAILVLGAMMLLTGAGFMAGEQLLQQLSLDNTVYLQAFVTGSILHVVIHQPHGHHDADSNGRFEYQAGIGSLIGISLLFLLLLMDSGAHQHQDHGSEQLMQWLLVLAPVLLLAYALASIRFALGVTPSAAGLKVQWLQRLAGPEALIISLLLLGTTFALWQIFGLLLLGALLTWSKQRPVDPHLNVPHSALTFGFAHIVDRSAPWVLLSLVLANLIGHPSIPLENPAIQLLILALLLLPMRFCNLGAAVLAISLAFSGWSNMAVIFILLAAPWLNLQQLKAMTWGLRLALAVLLGALLLPLALMEIQIQETFNWPVWSQELALLLLALLFAASLLRLGPRKFLRRLWHGQGPKAHAHKHGHKHDHSHGHHH
ncbi:metal transporter [Shewanella cyperi]|uniref:metal transporter n=1 Tax=Shewanella cyperi TaxID=2814292 RepID=UPI001A943384|nr:metal transporter [Shewanella cyperi]QSX40843.1 metal transporter [Shewanella cyperi]